MSISDPTASPPHALLDYGVALQTAAAAQSGMDRAKLVQSAFGMMFVVAGLQPPPRGKHLPKVAPSIRLKAWESSTPGAAYENGAAAVGGGLTWPKKGAFKVFWSFRAPGTSDGGPRGFLPY